MAKLKQIETVLDAVKSTGMMVPVAFGTLNVRLCMVYWILQLTLIVQKENLSAESERNWV